MLQFDIIENLADARVDVFVTRQICDSYVSMERAPIPGYLKNS
jgi:hypothetical protein